MLFSIKGLDNLGSSKHVGLVLSLLAVFVMAMSVGCTTLGDGGGGDDESSGDGGGRGRDANSGSADAGNTDDDPSTQTDTGTQVNTDTGTANDVGSAQDTSAPETEPEEDITPIEGFATITGTVWAPGNAPGLVPSGQEIPIYDALVYVTDERPAPIPPYAYCNECQDPPRTSVLTDYYGHFTIINVVPGNHWLVIEKGQFRREYPITLEGDEVLELDAEDTTLPSLNDDRFGMSVPRVAMAVGNYDQLEDILGKMGFGSVNASGNYFPESAMGRMDIYGNGGTGFGSVEAGSLTDLVTDLDRMLEYHVIFVPCASDANTSSLSSQQVLRNIRDYVAAGGKLYVTDWSGEWMDNVFPASIELGGSGNDTPASAYTPPDESNPDGSWNTFMFGDADGSSYDTPNADAIDEGLYGWLNGQQGPTAYSDVQTTYDAGHFEVEGNWNVVTDVVTTQVGIDAYGEALFDEPVVYVEGGSDYDPGDINPLTVTFEPTGCGRVLYSTYHTTDDTHVGLTPQERVLLYLIMEIGVCRTGKWYD